MSVVAVTSFETLLEHYCKEQIFARQPAELYEPVRYIMQREGKCVRPLLTLMSCDMLGGQTEEALPVAYAIELFHNFTLVHDDIMDCADLRRGKPTVHKKYGLNSAILSGDVMLLLVYQYMSQIEDERKFFELFSQLNDELLKVFEGQQMDINFEQRVDISEREYLHMIEYKTAALLGAAMLAGAIVADASVLQRQLAYQVGINLGLSFQIKDDYLDAFGDPALTGKKRGGDILQNKKTYLLVSALLSANAVQRSKIMNLLHETDEQRKIHDMLQLYEELDVRTKAKQKMHEYFQQAIDILQQIPAAEEKKQPLLRLAEKIYQRNY